MSKKRCVPCLGASLKRTLLEAFGDAPVRKAIEAVKDCPDPEGADFCYKKGKRTRSAYQTFVSECMRRRRAQGGDVTVVMQECAAEWRSQKK